MNRHSPHARGAVAVELALVSIPMVFAAVAAVDFARAYFVYDQLAKSVRDGARYLSFFDPNDAQQYPVTAAKNRMLYGTTANTGDPIVPGLEADMIKVCDSVNATACPGETFANVDTGSGSINLIQVKISGYVFTPIFPGISRLTTITFDDISSTMRQLYP